MDVRRHCSTFCYLVLVARYLTSSSLSLLSSKDLTLTFVYSHLYHNFGLPACNQLQFVVLNILQVS
jgi:hypothetical protein